MSESRESRFENRDKRRKANLVLNILIGIVLVLIVVVASSLMMNSPKEQATQDVSKNDSEQTKEAPASDNKKQTSDEDVKDKDDSKTKDDSADKEDSASDSDADKDQEKETASDEDKEKSDDPFEGAEVKEGGSSANVEKTIINPNWKPVGTKQSGEHTATYDSSSQDWAEMLEAISYATGVSKDNMTVIWLGNNGSPQDAKGTIQTNDSGVKYQVAITWVDGKGWKPTKVEKLK
ncbi:YrrS family protein [Bacillus sp. z60-18]|uniref:YrrS family protein n=1 Tax=Bacillus TaxID=1386 RepID=UPI00098B29FB|nr:MULTISPECIES: YrrS family protein [Bacillus]WFA03933.1 YrrS family protein [Bacillus sp. HSf4]